MYFTYYETETRRSSDLPKVPLLKRGKARPCPQICLDLSPVLFLPAFGVQGWHWGVHSFEAVCSN